MAFGYDTDMALRAAAALANSEHADPDALSTGQDLTDFVQTWVGPGRSWVPLPNWPPFARCALRCGGSGRRTKLPLSPG